jgi:hypothetical protein
MIKKPKAAQKGGLARISNLLAKFAQKSAKSSISDHKIGKLTYWKCQETITFSAQI